MQTVKLAKWNNVPAAAAGSAWSFYDLTTADGSSDTNTLIDSGPSYNSGTKVNTIGIDRDKGGALVVPASTAHWWWDTGLTAADDFGLQFELHFTDDADMQGSNIVVYCGLTSDTSAMDTYAYGAGANYQTNDLRGYRMKATVASVGGVGSSTEGIKITCVRAGTTTASSGNIAINYFMQALEDTTWLGKNNYYSVSNAQLSANASSDSLYFFVAIGITGANASVESVNFRLKVSPFVVNDI